MLNIFLLYGVCRKYFRAKGEKDCMNEGMTIFLNMDEREFVENEALIKKIDELLQNFGIEYTGVRNIYKSTEEKNRDHAVFAACHALRNTAWLKGKLAYTSIMNLTNACSMEQIQLDNMAEPSAAKLEYYEKYYQESHTLAHGIVVDEHRQLRDGYTSYLIARKYGICPDIYEAFAEHPLRKVVRGRHVSWNKDTWIIKSEKIYTWNYTLKNPVVPGDILQVRTKKGQAFIFVDRIDYVTGKEFCEEHKNVIKHMRERL